MNATVTTSPAQAIPGHSGRKGLLLQNNGAATIYILLGNTAVTADASSTTGGIQLKAGAVMLLNRQDIDVSQGVSAVVASGTATLTWDQSL